MTALTPDIPANTANESAALSVSRHAAVVSGPTIPAALSNQPRKTCALVSDRGDSAKAGSSAEIAGRVVTIALAATTAAT